MTYKLTKKAPEEAFISISGEDVLALSRECLEAGFPKEMSESFLARGKKRYKQAEILVAAKKGEAWPVELGYVFFDGSNQTAEAVCEKVLFVAIEEDLEFAGEFHDMAMLHGGDYKAWIRHSAEIASTLDLKTIQRNTVEFLSDMNETFASGSMDNSVIEDFFVTWLALASFHAVQSLKQ